jgi:AcrR family transcriptional regulator
MDAGILDRLDLPGVFPARQGRSRAVMLALMERALTMLQTRSFAELSVADLCAEEGCTIGSFYARFESKEAFLRAVQHAVIAEARRNIEARLTTERFAGVPLRSVVTRIVEGTVRLARRHEGLIRASLRAVQDDPAAWSPLRELGHLQAERAAPILLDNLGRPASKADAERVRFAFQVLFGTLNNMVLVNPGPFTIHDAETPCLLTETLTRLIETEP